MFRSLKNKFLVLRVAVGVGVGVGGNLLKIKFQGILSGASRGWGLSALPPLSSPSATISRPYDSEAHLPQASRPCHPSIVTEFLVAVSTPAL